MRPLVLALGSLLVASAPLLGQEHDHRPAPSAYAGAASPIASLSMQEIRDLETGAGMGLARAAELNRYPGPLHALELADSLGLTADQRARAQSIREAMLARAVDLGRRILEAEAALSRRFEHAHVDSTSLAEATAELGRLRGELQYAHLAAHLALKGVLSDAQVDAYDRLRGYRRTP